jgi:AraC family transcriptional regulator
MLLCRSGLGAVSVVTVNLSNSPAAEAPPLSGRRQRTEVAWVRSTERVITHMWSHLDETQSLAHLAEVAAASPYHFSRLFKHVTGVSPSRFLCAARITTAMRLLLTTELSVTNICFDVGYNSLGTFVRRFTELVGRSPCALRRAAANFRSSSLKYLGEAQPSGGSCSSLGGRTSNRLDVPIEFQGLVFVGLFAEPILHCRPEWCAILRKGGALTFESVPDGIYYVLAVGMPWTSSDDELLVNEGVIRADHGPLTIRGGVCRSFTLSLALPSAIQIPIVTSIPLLSIEVVGRIKSRTQQTSLAGFAPAEVRDAVSL